jgi:hypothetical protein
VCCSRRDEVKPRKTIRRFDVFAEYRKQEQQEKGDSERVASGYGLWVAKVVASRRFGTTRAGSESAPSGGEKKGEDGPKRQGDWHLLDGEPQTDALFDKEIVQRMGEEFYREVFVPEIRAAREEGKSYEAIRDSLRKTWNS